MSSPLLQEATRIAREFDYPADQVQRGVTEYIKQSNEGLANEDTTLSQIPTFVTAVPNGTEKVPSHHCAAKMFPLTLPPGSLSGRGPRRHQLPRVLRPTPWRHHLLPHTVQNHDPPGAHGFRYLQGPFSLPGPPNRGFLAHPPQRAL